MKNLQKRKQKVDQQALSGFTMVELSLVIGFVALLLIAIAVVTTNLIGLFQKGITLGAVNNVGRNLISDLNSSINAAPSIDSLSLCNKFLTSHIDDCLNQRAYKFIYQEETGSSTDTVQGVPYTVQYNGLFCTGTYSYAWNTWYGFRHNKKIEINYSLVGSTTSYTAKDFNIIRFEDPNYRACQQRVHDNYADPEVDQHSIDMRNKINHTLFQMTAPPSTDLLANAEANLSLYELVIFPVSQDLVTQRGFFAGTFILATGNGDVTIYRADETCAIKLDEQQRLEADSSVEAGMGGSILTLDSGFNYCGINKFNFAARSAGSGV